MPIVYGFLGLIGLIILLVLLFLFVPIVVRLSYEKEFQWSAYVIGIPVHRFLSEDLFPKKEKTTDEKEKPKKSGKVPEKIRQLTQEWKQSFEQDGATATVSLVKETARLIASAAKGILKGVTVSRLKIWLFWGAEDAGDAAVSYGQACSVVYPALTLLENAVSVKKHDIRIEPNFLSENSTACLDVRIRISVFRVLGALAILALRLRLQKDSSQTSEEE